ncbi:MAG: peptide deformylase [Nitrospira sp.]|mgnify:FL=1|nr:peptide deformylase [Nitrospira sp.]HMU30863.1 peptide deformylase [Nitrospira sp.]HMW86856.1 peptide deformylase [Nitrospira sp.]HMZ98233.1 peptide deformylase [Nitrospira sp.]HNA47682.1 peptide deformylase [Nitrospira sp.]
MAIRPILHYPHPTLKSESAPTLPSDPATPVVVQDLLDTLAASPGVALAAPQIGYALRVIVVDVSRKKGEKGHGLIVLINPVILVLEGPKILREGCLSVPDYTGNVVRYEQAVVEGLAPDGRVVTLTTSGFEALAFQHEVDHLNGLLFLDRIQSLSTDLFRRKTQS